MKRWVSENAPALAYVKDLGAWVIVNKETELISYTDDLAEAAWLSTWIMEYGETPETKAVANNAKPNPIVAARRRTIPRHNMPSLIVLAVRNL